MSDNVANTKQEIIKKNWGNLMKKLLLLVPKITVLSERKKTSRKTMIIVGLTFILLIFCILSPHILFKFLLSYLSQKVRNRYK